MTISEIRDLVRLKLGVPDLAPELLLYFLTAGRRTIEAEANLYWMAANVDFNFTVDQDTYDAVIDIQAVDYKEARSCFVKADDIWYPVGFGSPDGILPNQPSLLITGLPESIQPEDTLFTAYPTPDDMYDAKLFYFKWTYNSTSIVDTDELFTNWPQLILYAALAEGTLFTTTNSDLAVPYFKLMRDELEKAKAVTAVRLKEKTSGISTREAARILQASGGGK